MSDASSTSAPRSFHFEQLTPDRILDALESIGLYASSGLLPLNSYENRVYQFVGVTTNNVM